MFYLPADSPQIHANLIIKPHPDHHGEVLSLQNLHRSFQQVVPMHCQSGRGPSAVMLPQIGPQGGELDTQGLWGLGHAEVGVTGHGRVVDADLEFKVVARRDWTERERHGVWGRGSGTLGLGGYRVDIEGMATN